MIASLVRLALVASAAAVPAHVCTDDFPNPPTGVSCHLVSGAFHDGDNCWGSCTSGCPSLSCPSSCTTCYFETRGISVTDDCVWPMNRKLCCAHIKCATKLEGGVVVNMTMAVKEGLVVEDVTEHVEGL